MTPHQSLLKPALLEELSNGHYRLLNAENPQDLVSDIEFNNRKAARNWARSRGFVLESPSLNDADVSGLN
ncbi:hypothetical protein [Pelagicoccus sp. SDUM812003]|uniref:hypothetical protein n=1 Tax=Pelagicoccus sp. SDUM812003 TaxID=3041267 RepID=UPI0028107667|nr:hypothetical protein [Pelagicoccus sp. SDUM812003]MDQ8201689.1 hypothetical protein [Pelagicoccus sp. SDUM812003]